MPSKRRGRSRSRTRSRSRSAVRKSRTKRSSKRSRSRSESSSDDGDYGRSRSLSLTPEKSYNEKSPRRHEIAFRRTRSASSSPARSPKRARSTSRSKRSGGGRYGRSRTRSRSRGRSRFSRSPRRYSNHPKAPEPCKVLGVFNLNYNTTKRDLEREFGQFGKLTKADLVVDPRGDSRGFGFVSFERQRDADYARERMTDTLFDGMTIRVDYSISRGPHRKTPGCYMGDNRQVRRDYHRHGSNYSSSGRSSSRQRSRSPFRRGSRDSPDRRSYSRLSAPTSSSRFSPIRWRQD